MVNLIIESGGVCNDAIIRTGADVNIQSGGTLNTATLLNNIAITSASLSNIRVVNRNSLELSEGDTGSGITGLYKGSITIGEGSVASNVTINLLASLSIESDTAVDSASITMGSATCLGAVSNVTVESDGSLSVNGGVISAVAIKDRGVLKGLRGNAYNTIVFYGGSAEANTAFNFSNTLLSSCGILRILGGRANEMYMTEPYGILHVSHGSCTDITESGGYVYTSGAAFYVPHNVDNLTIDWPAATFHSGVAASNTTVNTGRLIAYDGSILNNTSVNSTGKLYVFGADVYNTTVSSGYVLVSSGFVSGGYFTGGTFIMAGGSASSLIFENVAEHIENGIMQDIKTVSGKLYISGGECWQSCNISNCVISVYGGILADANVSSSTITQRDGVISSVIIHDNTVLDNGYGLWFSGGSACETVGSAYNITVLSGCALSAYNTSDSFIHDGGSCYVRRGENKNIQIFSGASVTVASDSWASDGRGGYYLVSKGGSCTDTVVYSGGYLAVYSGGCALNTKESGGWVDVEYGAAVTFNTNVDYVKLSSGNSATVHQGTLFHYPEVYSGGKLTVYSGGLVNRSVIWGGGYLTVSSGGSAVLVTSKVGAAIDVKEGGYITYAE